MCRADLGGQLSRSLIARGVCGGPQIKKINTFPKAAQPRFSPISGQLWVRAGGRDRVRVRVRAKVRARGWVWSTPGRLSDHEVIPAGKRERATAPKIRAANLLGELH